MKLRLGLVLCALFASIAFLASTNAGAQQSSTGGGSGLQISPTRNEIIVNPGETKTFKITLKNVTSGAVSAKGFVNDFQSDGVTGEPQFVVEDKKDNPQSIKPFVKGVKNFDLAVGESKEVEFSLAIPANAAPGAYYGAIRYASVPKTQDNDTGAGQQISLTASVASLVLVQVSGQTKEGIKIDQAQVLANGSAGKFFTKAPTEAHIKITNIGNTFAQPFGQVNISKRGKNVFTYELNSTAPRGNILPNSSRTFKDQLKNTGSLGKYTITVSSSHKQGGTVVTYTDTFWVVPVWAIAVGCALLILLLGAGGIAAYKIRGRK